MKRITYLALLLFIHGFLSVQDSYGQVKLPALFNDNMVLQQKTDAPVWGWASPGEKITVRASWEEESRKTLADKSGHWLVRIPTPGAGGPFSLSVEGKSSITIKNIMIGEVWICSGQSNMQKQMGFRNGQKPIINFAGEIAGAKHPGIRLFQVGRQPSDTELDNCEGNWLECSPENVIDFSAVGYFFGKYLEESLSVPIGLIQTTVGGTPAEAWMSERAMKQGKYQGIYEDWATWKKDYPADSLDYYTALKNYEEKKTETLPVMPASVYRMIRYYQYPSILYNGMIRPLIPFAFKGVIWYQGESNKGDALLYEDLFSRLIQSWREEWNIGEFPFYFVQIAPYGKTDQYKGGELREAQRIVDRDVVNTGMAVTLDIGDPLDIHPAQKNEVGRRLALLALSKTYGYNDIVCSGPEYRSMEIKDDQAILSFELAGQGVIFTNNRNSTGFYVAGEDHVFYPAEARLDEDKIIVSCRKVPQPIAVRYAWEDATNPSVFNSVGLPASTFRTDDWEDAEIISR